ncbi:MAG: PRC-barrel domain-containing protein [Ectothiorhodospiraceae bacterium]|nr:PRC-barrel domain-containing protein [Ectothiorhodospiraceae bacterium]
MMKKLNAMALSALLLPALSLGSVAFADGTYGGHRQANGQHAQDQRVDRAGGQLAQQRYISRKPAGTFHADEFIGSNVKHRGSDEDIGKVQNLIIGEDGQIVGVVLAAGGFMGLGGQRVALSWNQLEHTREDNASVFYVHMDEDTLRHAPAYEKD